MGSASATALANAVGIRRIRKEGATLNIPNEVVVNWGNSSMTRTVNCRRVLNPYASVHTAVNKLRSFTALQAANVPIPDFTTDREEALGWITDGLKVVCRTRLEGSGGEGIVVATTHAELVNAPLYVRYMPKEHEYRIHVNAVAGEAFFVQRKARRTEVPDAQVNWAVRNLEGGFIYANQNIIIAPETRDAAIAAVRALALDFGAVDILVTPRGRIAVLEVNTACGLAGTTLDKYVEMLTSLSAL